MDITDTIATPSIVESSFVNTTRSSTGPPRNTTFLSTETLNQTQTGPLGDGHIIVLTLMTLVMILGTIGNIHCLIFFAKRFLESKQPQHKRNSYAVFVISLAILDLFACVFLLPLDIANTSAHFTPLSEGLCRTFRFLQFAVHMSSILHICLISVHCWRQEGYPHSSQLMADIAIKLCAAVDIVAIIPSSPVISLSGYTTITIEGVRGQVCMFSDEYAETCIPPAYLAVIFTLFLISFVIVSSSYVALIYFRYQRSRGRYQSSDGLDREDQTEEAEGRKNTVTLVILVVIYFTTYMIFLIFSAVIFSEDFEYSNQPGAMTVIRIFTFSPLLNHVVNPLVYGWRDDEFRKKIKHFYACNRKSGTSA